MESRNSNVKATIKWIQKGVDHMQRKTNEEGFRMARATYNLKTAKKGFYKNLLICYGKTAEAEYCGVSHM